MLRKLIKSLLPSKSDIFFILFEEASVNAHEAAKIFVDIINSKDPVQTDELCANSRILKQKANDINKKVLQQLSKMFITPIDRGDIQELSGLLNKLTKRIVKISTKLKIYNIDANTDDCLIKNANTLLIITKALVDCVSGLKVNDGAKIAHSSEKINELEENGIEDFRHAINEMYSGKFDTLTILKLKEIYKSIDSAIELSVSAADLIAQVSLKSI
ncbi:MAG: hypothetical protein K0R49_1581 [Burkholderiales bacterium]|jgi:uncharacterized protein Yka (UPF0111/DUF47 family)|nr:hypothetical protein [Burkholderiales bacterium]